MCQKLYVPNDVCTQLFADADVRFQLYMRVYKCVNMLMYGCASMLMCVKSYIYLMMYVHGCLQRLTYVCSCICKYIPDV